MIQIVPAIIPKSFTYLEEKVGLIYTAASEVQVDICDGKFTGSVSWPFVEDRGEFHRLISEEKGLPHWEEIDYEMHLMTKTPADEVSDWVKAGASRLVVHIEAGSDAIEDILNEWGHTAEFAIAIKMETPVSAVAGFLSKVRTFQLMGSSKIGFQGQKLDDRIYERVKELRALAPDHVIAIDIGVNEETASKLVSAGANKLIIGSAIMDSDVPSEALEKFKRLSK
ncbi:MAG: hypothetical protein HYV68_03715 [Candidatus Taylorbacteria bacterium]|nr:hypothetical protein [Candidatus Taylorbacteria bacterium]